MNKIIVGGIIAVVLTGSVSFYAGMKFGNRGASGWQTAARVNQTGQLRGREQAVGMSNQLSMADGSMSGEIISKDDTGITIKLHDGGSRIVFISASARIQKIEAGLPEDLMVGGQVVVTGEVNSDGSLDARTIEMGRGMQFGGNAPRR